MSTQPLSILHIDLSTGKKTEIVTSFQDYGELSRSWAWAAQTATFYLPVRALYSRASVVV